MITIGVVYLWLGGPYYVMARSPFWYHLSYLIAGLELGGEILAGWILFTRLF